MLGILLSNALQSSERGATVSLKVNSDRRWLKVSVSDSGPSVSLHLRKAIFDRFAGKEPMPGRRGTGLSLELCRAIVELHRGEIGVGGGDDGDCSFWFTLPQQS